MHRLSPRGFLVWLTATMLAVMLLLVCLPHDPYIRFQQVAQESVHYLRLKWIYERIHHDATPIDVAFIGTSHTQSGIDDARVEAQARAMGLDARVVNFAVPHLGRDLEFVVVRELLAHRPVRTLVVELQETEARAPHPGFQRLGTVQDLLQAPWLVNTGLVENFVRLPVRQTRYALASVLPAAFGMQAAFDPAAYEGPHWNDTYIPHGFTEPRTRQEDWAFHEPELRKLRRETDAKEQLARRFDGLPLQSNLLYRYNEIYLQRMVDLARDKGVRLVFLYLPAPDAQRLPRVASGLQTFGPVLDARPILQAPGLWQNADHLNVFGARVLSDWVAAELARQARDAGAVRAVP